MGDRSYSCCGEANSGRQLSIIPWLTPNTAVVLHGFLVRWLYTHMHHRGRFDQ